MLNLNDNEFIKYGDEWVELWGKFKAMVAFLDKYLSGGYQKINKEFLYYDLLET